MLNDLFYAVLGMLPWTCALIAALLVWLSLTMAAAEGAVARVAPRRPGRKRRRTAGGGLRAR